MPPLVGQGGGGGWILGFHTLPAWACTFVQGLLPTSEAWRLAWEKLQKTQHLKQTRSAARKME